MTQQAAGNQTLQRLNNSRDIEGRAVELGSVTSGEQLIPVFLSQIDNVPTYVCDGRALHQFLENGDLFANWIKARIEKYGF